LSLQHLVEYLFKAGLSTWLAAVSLAFISIFGLWLDYFVNKLAQHVSVVKQKTFPFLLQYDRFLLDHGAFSGRGPPVL
jgi:hypothetical protein